MGQGIVNGMPVISKLDDPPTLVNEKGERCPHIVLITDIISCILIITVLNMWREGLNECTIFF